MSEKEKPLPRPPKTPFGRRRFEAEEGHAPLMADRMAEAMASGKLEEFMKDAIPDNDYARTLAKMMMGMTGMIPPGALPSAEERAARHADATEGVEPFGESPSGVQTPEDVTSAARAGDIMGVMGILAREHKKRMSEAGSTSAEQKEPDRAAGLSDGEKKTLDRLIEVASENNVSVDWVVLRALNLYLKEYEKTGRL